jgi:hypothetical protein
MTPQTTAIIDVRHRRAHRANVARALIARDGGLDLQAIDWQQLAALPAWCLWPAPARDRLARLAGALFAAPGMRLWISGSLIEAARALLGADLFEQVMARPGLPGQAPAVPAQQDLARLFDGAGRSVLLGSLPAAWMRAWIAPLLPQPDAHAPLCPLPVAAPLVRQALRLLEVDGVPA